MLRSLIAISTAGAVWFGALTHFFVLSGAQAVLADPSRQSEKFIAAFSEEPLPLAAESPYLLFVGFVLCGAIAAAVFSILNDRFSGGVIRRGLIFGGIQWALMVPWFEFYLPFNVMREPLPLVLLEMALWLGVMLSVGMWVSFVLNFRRG